MQQLPRSNFVADHEFHRNAAAATPLKAAAAAAAAAAASILDSALMSSL